MMEQAGLLCKEFSDVEGCVNLLERAADLFHQNGTADTAALTLDRAAKYTSLSLSLSLLRNSNIAKFNPKYASFSDNIF